MTANRNVNTAAARAIASGATLVAASKRLSFVLRHRPGSIGLVLDEGGWAGVDELLARLNAAGAPFDRALLEAVVRTNDKQRFAFSDDGARIRANQGHSVAVELGLTAQTPPKVLYHGTASRFLDSIEAGGLEPRRRHHVHLSPDAETARKVGGRHGRPVVLTVDAERMASDGFVFFLSANGVWLTAAVPPRYLTRSSEVG